MVVPRSKKKQKEMEQEASDRLVPERLLPPDELAEDRPTWRCTRVPCYGSTE
jgi:hypothetical protein